MLKLLKELQQKKIISLGDYYFAQFIAEKQQGLDYPTVVQDLAILLAALCNHSQLQGNTCLYLDNSLISNLFNLNYSKDRHYLNLIQNKINFTSISNWQEILKNHIAFTDNPQQKIAPLVFQFNALYFYRTWQDEYKVAGFLQRAVSRTMDFSQDQEQQIAQILNQYFTETGKQQGQKLAVAVALRQPFCLISGGPGTGKTYTVARLLLALQELQQKQNLETLQIKLVAPTGKAATRLNESIMNALASIEIGDNLRNAIPTEATTIHRLLKIRLLEGSSRFHQQNPLSADVLVVDEASMVDLSLMAKLLNALKPTCKLILLGDKDQLASVEAGAILGELGQFLEQGYSPELTRYLQRCANIEITSQIQGNPIRDTLCFLSESRRFNAESGIGNLANAINKQDSNYSWQLFEQYSDLHRINFDEITSNSVTKNEDEHSLNCANYVIHQAATAYAEFFIELHQITETVETLTQTHLERIFTKFNAIRFLTPLRLGYFGVEYLNQGIADCLRQRGIIQFLHSRDWYQGKPIMVLQNDSSIGLSNGDIGLFIMDRSGKAQVWFEVGESQYKSFSATRIPPNEPAYVMTVHKSQGSEFTHTMLVLPTEPTPILCKELIYTAVTRAKKEFTLFSSEQIWKLAVKQKIKRQSGLANLLNIQSLH